MAKKGPGLNRAQQSAVEHGSGPLLVLAGAGSGKTRVITHRIAKLIERGNHPSTIFAVSFTNKAAAEMGERMVPLIGKAACEKLWLSTFHSFGVRFLREESKRLGYGTRFVIFDQGDALGLVREILRDLQVSDRSLDIPAVLQRISLWKNAFLRPEEVKTSTYEYDEVAQQVYPIYQEQLANMHAVDFDDLVVAPARILQAHEDVREKWRARFRHLLVDEFQDTNRSQLELVRLLVGASKNVCVVGDDDQSIYGWRGAEVGNILDFERHFGGATIVKLEECYRCREPIIAVANAVISQSRGKRHEKQLRAVRGPGPKVRVVATPDAAEEAKLVTREIIQLAKGGPNSPGQRLFRYGHCAVLYRSNTQGRLIEEELRIAGIPYRLYGGTQFFDRKEVKDVIAYLKVVDNERDELSLRRVLNVPTRGIGEATLKKVKAYAARRNLSFHRALRAAAIDGELSNQARRGVMSVFAAIDNARRALDAKQSLVQVTQGLLDETGLAASIAKDDSAQGKRRRENLFFLLRAFERYEQKNKLTLNQLLTQLTLRFENEEEGDKDNMVTLSSLHSAKGLEFEVVFLIGCVEGTMPHARTVDPKLTEAAPTDVDEERRLFYVGITRARELLYLTRPERKTLRGKVTPRIPSRFLEGFPDDAWETYRTEGEKELDPEEMAAKAREFLARLRG